MPSIFNRRNVETRDEANRDTNEETNITGVSPANDIQLVKEENKLKATVFGDETILTNSKVRDGESSQAILEMLVAILPDDFELDRGTIDYTAFDRVDVDSTIKNLNESKVTFTVAYTNIDDDIVIQKTGYEFIDKQVEDAIEDHGILNSDIVKTVDSYIKEQNSDKELAAIIKAEEERVAAVEDHNSKATTVFESIQQFDTTRKFANKMLKVLADYEGLIDIVSVEETIETADMHELNSKISVTDIDICKVDRNKVTIIENDLNINFVDAIKSEFLIVNTQGNTFFLQERV